MGTRKEDEGEVELRSWDDELLDAGRLAIWSLDRKFDVCCCFWANFTSLGLISSLDKGSMLFSLG